MLNRVDSGNLCRERTIERAVMTQSVRPLPSNNCVVLSVSGLSLGPTSYFR